MIPRSLSDIEEACRADNSAVTFSQAEMRKVLCIAAAARVAAPAGSVGDDAERAAVEEWAISTQQCGPSLADVWAIYLHGKESALLAACAAPGVPAGPKFFNDIAFDKLLHGVTSSYGEDEFLIAKRELVSYINAPVSGVPAPVASNEQLIRAFNSGYKSGHHDTVEGNYTDIDQRDMFTYHADVIAEMIADGTLAAPAAPTDRDSVLEEAAKACDFQASWARGEANDESNSDAYRNDQLERQIQADVCADEIRRMKDSPANLAVPLPADQSEAHQLSKGDILQIFADNAQCSENGDNHGYAVVYERHALAIAAALFGTATPATPPAAPEVQTMTLTGHQINAALDLIAPMDQHGGRDLEEMDNDLTFGIVQHKDDDGAVATGMCCWNDDTDGVLPLDEHPDEAIAAAPTQTGG